MNAYPSPATAPVVASGSGLPELRTLIKQNSSAVVNISVEGGSMANALPEGLPPPNLNVSSVACRK